MASVNRRKGKQREPVKKIKGGTLTKKIRSANRNAKMQPMRKS